MSRPNNKNANGGRVGSGHAGSGHSGGHAGSGNHAANGRISSNAANGRISSNATNGRTKHSQTPIQLGKPAVRDYWRLTRPVFVVGFMGAGKTTNSRKLARQCGLATVDLDSFIERREGKAIRDIFAEQGEDAFRKLETEALHEFASECANPLIVSCGGGIVLRPENRQILKTQGFVIFLHATADQAAAHIHDLSTRPLFRDLENARQVNADRQPLYEEVSDITIETSGKTVQMITREMKRVLKKEGVLCPQQK